MMPAGKALLKTCVNTSFGLPPMTWIGMPKWYFAPALVLAIIAK